mgnify:CR=1 FL=1
MKQLLLFIGLAAGWLTAQAQGIPVLRNFTPEDYHANSMNNDIEIGADGTVYVANFEGLLYYDNVDWHTIYTPEITRLTVVYRDKNDNIWVGGYNFFGKIERKPNGDLRLQRVGQQNLFHGEVEEIWEQDGVVNFFVDYEGIIYAVNGNKVSVKKTVATDAHAFGMTDIIATEALEKEKKVVILTDTTQTLPLDNGLKAIVIRGQGFQIADERSKQSYQVTEENGLCSNNVVYLAYDGHGTLWGAADNGIFALSVPSVYSHFTENEGLVGNVLSITEYEGRMYAGTNNGLYRQEDHKFTRVGNITHACWSLAVSKQGLLAATANGIYLISPGQQVRQLTSISSMFVMNDGDLLL